MPVRERLEGPFGGPASRDLDVQHKTAFVLMHKLREAMAAETRDVHLEGERGRVSEVVEIGRRRNLRVN